MFWFRLLFPLAMIFAPLVATLLVPHCPDPDDDLRQRAVRLRRWWAWLWTATLASAGLFLVLFFAWNAAIAYFLWLLFFPLWFGLACRVLLLKHHGWRNQVVRQATRSARLVPRDPQPGRWRWVLWLAGAEWLACLAISTWFSLATSSAVGFAASTALLSSSGVWLLVGPWAARMATREPEPMPPGGGAELEAAYAVFRRRKAAAWYLFAALPAICFSPLAVYASFAGQDGTPIIVWLGTGGGVAFGLAGGAFGTWADAHRARLGRIYRAQSR